MPASESTPTAIALPRCPKCGGQMSLLTVLLDRERNDQRVYECARCQHEVTEVINFKQAS